MLACDWNGHSYSASMTLAADLNASSTLPFSFFDLALAHRRFADVIVERRLFRERRRGAAHSTLSLSRRLDRVPFAVGDDAEEALVQHHLGAGNVLDRAFVDLDRHRAGDRRPDHPAVHHAGHFDVDDEIFLAEDFRRDVVALDRLADDLVILRVLRLGLARRVQRIAVFAVPVELHIEIAAADQFGVAYLLCCVAYGVDDAVGHRQLIRRQAEFFCRQLDQHAPRFGCGHAHLLAAVLDAGRAGGAALVHARFGVAHEHADALERHVELFRHDLADRGIETLRHVGLAEEGGDRAVGIHRDVGG